TYTVRSNSTDGHPLGLRGLISPDDGETWDFAHDRIVISDRNHGASGGGVGNTGQLPARALGSGYSYRGADGARHIEAVRWTVPQGLAEACCDEPSCAMAASTVASPDRWVTESPATLSSPRTSSPPPR